MRTAELIARVYGGINFRRRPGGSDQRVARDRQKLSPRAVFSGTDIKTMGDRAIVFTLARS